MDLSGLSALAEKVGLGGAVLLVFVAGVAFRFPGVLRELKGILEVYTRYKIEKMKITSRVKSTKETVLKELKSRIPDREI